MEDEEEVEEEEEDEGRGNMPRFNQIIIPGKFDRFLFKQTEEFYFLIE